MSATATENSSDQRGRFAPTDWSVVARASGSGEGARIAFGELCQVYWYPLYAFVRRSGQTIEDAEDTVQEFMRWLLERHVVERADPGRGRFRTFLLAALQQFVARQRRHEGRAKRRPAFSIISIDAVGAERRYQLESRRELSAAQTFEHYWARTVIERATLRMRREAERKGQVDRFDRLSSLLAGESRGAVTRVSQELGVSEGGVRVAVHRLRRRFAEVIRDEVGQTVDVAEAVEDELRQLLSALNPLAEERRL